LGSLGTSLNTIHFVEPSGELPLSSVRCANLFPTFLSKRLFVVPMVSAIPATRECTLFVVGGNHIYHHARDNAIYDFSKKAVENGLDIFRVFDSLNYIGAFVSFR
jgi:hypothetical protein